MSDLDLIHPHAVPGHNEAPDYARLITDEMQKTYLAEFELSAALRAEARNLPAECNDEDTAGKYAALIKRIRDHAKVLTSHHDKEKLPFKIKAEAIDSVFFGEVDKLARRDKKNQAGAADVLYARYDDFQQRKLAAEKLKRDRELEEAAKIERDKVAAAQAAAAAEEEARQVLERARAPAQIERKEEIVEQAAAVADSAKVDAIMATDKADAAELATKAKPADMTRTRYSGGVLGTMGTEPFVEITDRATLDLEKLRPHLPIAVLETALRAYATGVGYSSDPAFQIAGARFGKKARSRIK